MAPRVLRRPSKLLTYEVLLAELGESLIKASPLEDALGILVKTDVALLLIDVSMPGADGFELTRLVRSIIPASGTSRSSS